MIAIKVLIEQRIIYDQQEGNSTKLADEAAVELARLQGIEQALTDLFQACSRLPVEEMDKMETEIKQASAALGERAK